jgi:F-type H+-transporting ATPase subunit alpha
VLKQPQYRPLPVEQEVLAIFAVTEGHMDDIPVGDIRRFEVGLRDFALTRYGSVLDGIRESGKLPEGDKLVEIIDACKATFEKTASEE